MIKKEEEGNDKEKFNYFNFNFCIVLDNIKSLLKIEKEKKIIEKLTIS